MNHPQQQQPTLSPSPLENCARCHYYIRQTPPGHPMDQGRCCYLPPVIQVINAPPPRMPGIPYDPTPVDQVMTCWPTLNGHEWCGKFEESRRIDLNTRMPAGLKVAS